LQDMQIAIMTGSQAPLKMVWDAGGVENLERLEAVQDSTHSVHKEMLLVPPTAK
jgi:hypothetical protein